MDKAFLDKQKQKLLVEKEKIDAQLLQLKSSDPFSDPDHATDNASPDTDAREPTYSRGCCAEAHREGYVWYLCAHWKEDPQSATNACA
jgi:hypothetical protein